MRANMMQPMPNGFDGPFSVPAPTANGGGFLHRMLGQFHMPQQQGYDSSGINPHGMYNGAFGRPPMPGRQFPANPGGFQPVGGLTAMFNRYRGG